ncbi:MAG: ribonuclease III [Candidatus Fimenecus sp.]
MDKLKEFEKNICYEFKNIELLKLALTHSSYSNENRSGEDNERLEFLGDSVLGFVAADYLYNHHRKFPEGQLTKLRAYAVCEQSLAGFAKEIELGKFLYLGTGEDKNGGRERKSITSDAFEAVIAAIFLDGGIDEAKKFVLRFIKSSVEMKPTFNDYKTVLQEIVQQNPGDILAYRLVSEDGPDHDKSFTVEVLVDGNVIGKGTSGSKKKAEQAAAKSALELMGI